MKQAAKLFVIISVVAGCVDPVGVTKLDQPEEGQAELKPVPRFGEHACSPVLANDEKVKIRYVEFVVPASGMDSEKTVSIATWENENGLNLGYTNGDEYCDAIQVTGATPDNLKEFVGEMADGLFKGNKGDCAEASGIYEKTSQLLETSYGEKVVAPLVGATFASLALACSGVKAPKPDDAEWVSEHLEEFFILSEPTISILFVDRDDLLMGPLSKTTTRILDVKIAPGGVELFEHPLVLETKNEDGRILHIEPYFYYSQCRPTGNKEEFRWGVSFNVSLLSVGSEVVQKGSVTFLTIPANSRTLSGSRITAWNSPVTSPGKISTCFKEKTYAITDCSEKGGLFQLVRALFEPLYTQTVIALDAELDKDAYNKLAEYVTNFIIYNAHMFCAWTETLQGDDAGNMFSSEPVVTAEQIEAIVSKLSKN